MRHEADVPQAAVRLAQLLWIGGVIGEVEAESTRLAVFSSPTPNGIDESIIVKHTRMRDRRDFRSIRAVRSRRQDCNPNENDGSG